MGKKYLSIYITNNIGIETMRLRFERKQVLIMQLMEHLMTHIFIWHGVTYRLNITIQDNFRR